MEKKRDINLDLIRCVAVLLVISVHFLHNNEFYKTIVTGEKMFLLTAIRTFSMICVPLFLLLTGYLMHKKTLKKSYYKGIIKTLLIYVIASICCLLFKKYYLGNDVTFASGILGILDFSACGYAWYIEMYIGLFLLIPFLNIVYHNLETAKTKRVLIYTFLALTTLPSVLNIFNIGGGKGADELVPDFWIELYPITYYFIGAYLAEYKNDLKLNKWLNFALILIVIIVATVFSYVSSYEEVFNKGLYVKNGALQNVVLAVLVFIFLNNLNLDKVSKGIKKIVLHVSKVSLGIYLVSYIFDKAFYPILNSQVAKMTDRLQYYLSMVVAVFICSLILASIINVIVDFILKIFKRNNKDDEKNKYLDEGQSTKKMTEECMR